jgi:hypothetical protein
VVGAATASVVAAFLIVPRLGFTWLPDFDGGEFNVNIRTAPGSSLEYTMDRSRAVAAVLRRNPEVEFTYLTIGGGFRGTPNTGQIYVKLTPKAARERTQQDIQQALRRELPRIPGIRAAITGTPNIFGGFRQPDPDLRAGARAVAPQAGRAAGARDGAPRPGRRRAAVERRGRHPAARRARRPRPRLGLGDRHREHRGDHPAALHRAARDDVGGRLGLRARRGGDLPRLAARLVGRRGGDRDPGRTDPRTGSRRWCRCRRWPTCAPAWAAAGSSAPRSSGR